MYCPNCGKEIPEGSRFCMHCGADLSGKVEISPNISVSPRINVTPSTETKTSSDEMCAICGKKRAVVKCKECGRKVCNYHSEYVICTLCAIEGAKDMMRYYKEEAENARYCYERIVERDYDHYDYDSRGFGLEVLRYEKETAEYWRKHGNWREKKKWEETEEKNRRKYATKATTEAKRCEKEVEESRKRIEELKGKLPPELK